jgi:hypothetical protein
LTLEIARLKLQGKCVYGSFDLESVPMPTPQDFLRDAQRFEEWWRDEFSKEHPLETMSPAACVNTILMHLGRFLRIKRDVIEFNKRRLIRKYLENNPPFVNDNMFRLVEDFLNFHSLSEAENEQLKQYTRWLRTQMNNHLGISV